MKHIYSHKATQEIMSKGNWQAPATFFHNRGSSIQKTFEGLLRSILVKILLGLPNLFSVVSLHGREHSPLRMFQMQEKDNPVQQSFLWTVKNLKAAFESVLREGAKSLKLCIFVDALDEYEGDHGEIARFLRQLVLSSGQGSAVVKILVASREEQIFADEFRGLPSSQSLSIHHWTGTDIKTYVSIKLRAEPAMQDFLRCDEQKEAYSLISAITNRAKGVFLWVALVVNELIVILRDRPPSLRPLFKKLEGLPQHLPDFYRLILQGIRDPNVLEAYVLLESVLRAHQPLTVIQLAHVSHVAVTGLRNEDQKLSEDIITQTGRQAPNFIVRLQTICRGLLQVRPRAAYVEDDDDDGDYDEDDDLEERHQRRLAGYRDYVQRLREPMVVSRVEDLRPEDRLRCTVQLLHQSVKEFLLLPGSMSVLIRQDVPQAIQPSYKNGHIFLLEFCLQLIQVGSRLRRPLRQSQSWSDTVAVREWTAIHAPAAERTTKRDLSELLNALDERFTLDSTAYWPSDTGFYYQHNVTAWKVNFLAFAVSQNMQIYVKAQLERDSKAIKTKKGRPLLYFAMWSPEKGNVMNSAMVKLLLDHGADVCKKWKDGDGFSKDALQSMAFYASGGQGSPHCAVIKQLLEAGADPNGVNPDGNIPVLHFVMRMNLDSESRLDLLKSLKQHGANLRISNRGKEILDVAFEAYYVYRQLDTVSAQEIRWLFEQGAVVAHPDTYSHLAFKTSPFYEEDFRTPSHYGPVARELARQDHPHWGPPPSSLSRATHKLGKVFRRHQE